MSRVRTVSSLALTVVLAACGGSGSAPSTPSTPVAVATPTPSAPSAAAFTCPLPALPDLHNTCPKLTPQHADIVTAAIDATIRQHPEYFDLNDATGGGSFRVLDRSRYIGAVVANIHAQGVCAKEELEEVAVKTSNEFNEQYNIWTSSGYIRRPPGAYITTCFPAQF